MELEKEIKQNTRFTSEYHKLTVNILYTASWLGMSTAKRLKPYELTTQQFNILRILRGQHPKPATINLLIERMIDKSSNASRLVDRLEDKGFVSRCTSDSDKRSVNVAITEKGLDTLKQIDEHVSEFEEPLKTITVEEARKMNQLLDQLRG